MMKEADLSKLFASFIEKDADFQDVLKIVKNNSEGKIWIIGGYITRNLAHLLFSTGSPEEGDYDFLVEEVNRPISVPKHWEVRTNSFGNTKIVNLHHGTEADIVPITNVHSIKSAGLEPTIENFLTGVPLNIQAICYDLTTEKLIGDVGIDAIMSRVVTIHNEPAALHRANMKGITPTELASQVAKSFNFQLRV